MYQEKDIVVGSVWQSMGGITLRVVVDICDTHVVYKYVMGSDGMPRTAEQTKKEFELDGQSKFNQEMQAEFHERIKKLGGKKKHEKDHYRS
mgnify:CR=1 FL=1